MTGETEKSINEVTEGVWTFALGFILKENVANMTDKELKRRLAKMKEFQKKATASKKAAKKALVDAGIYTAKGNLKQAYR